MRTALILLTCLVATACSKTDQAQANKAGAEVKADAQAAVHSVTDDPNLKKLGHDIHVEARKAGTEIKKGAADIKVQANAAGREIKDKTR